MMDPLWHSLIWSAFKSYKSCVWSMKHFYFWTSQIFVMCLKYLYNICDVLRRQEIFIIDEKKEFLPPFSVIYGLKRKNGWGGGRIFPDNLKKQLKYDKLLASQDVAGHRQIFFRISATSRILDFLLLSSEARNIVSYHCQHVPMCT